ncbi:4026_t:CDS:2 [Entrophospora sp. SA101]|nr:4026_t:CDS:2 [Entrophospora sp. SA101]
MEKQKQQEHAAALLREEKAKELYEKINNLSLSFTLKKDKNDKVFGSIRTEDILKEMKNLGFQLEKKQLLDFVPLNNLGDNCLKIKLSENLTAQYMNDELKVNGEEIELKGRLKTNILSRTNNFAYEDQGKIEELKQDQTIIVRGFYKKTGNFANPLFHVKKISLQESSKLYFEAKGKFFSAEKKEQTEKNIGLAVEILLQACKIRKVVPTDKELNLLEEGCQEVFKVFDFIEENIPSSKGKYDNYKKATEKIKILVQQEKSHRRQRPNQPSSSTSSSSTTSNNSQLNQLQKELQSKQMGNKSSTNLQQPNNGFNWLYVVIPGAVLLVVMGIIIAYLVATKSEKSILCRYGDTVVLTVLCLKQSAKASKLNFVPLTIFFEEKFYSVGKIPAVFNKREGKPDYNSVTIARLIDRSIRSFFPLGGQYEIQITNSVLITQLDESSFELIITASKENIVMVELEAEEIAERELEKAVIFAQEQTQQLLHFFQQIAQRIDGRKQSDIRPLNIKINCLPNVHGSALFQRGETQVLSVVTLGKSSDRQLIDNIFVHTHKHFIHHYNFPAFAVNEIAGFKSLSRREIGHGQLVEKTFPPLLPSVEDFPYTIRVVSEVLSSDGSSSQASICATSLALLSAGIPLKNPIAGIALGLLEGEILVDINGLEDKFGEMDYKVAGTEKGVCSLQLDVKNQGISFSIFQKTLQAGKKARIYLLQEMNKYLPKTRPQLTSQVAKFRKFFIGVERFGLIVGSQGKTINRLIQETGVNIDLQPDGFALLYHHDEQQLTKAISFIESQLKKR